MTFFAVTGKAHHRGLFGRRPPQLRDRLLMGEQGRGGDPVNGPSSGGITCTEELRPSTCAGEVKTRVHGETDV